MAFQLLRSLCSQHLAQRQANVERADLNEQTFENIIPFVRGTASHSAGFVATRKGSFDQLSSSL